MAFKLELADANTVVDFMSNAYLLTDGGLELNPPEKSETWGSVSRYGLGSRLLDFTYENRTIKIVFQLVSATRSGLVQQVSVIERLLHEARQRSMENGIERVELRYQWDGHSNLTYFEVVDGVFKYPDGLMSVEQIIQFDGQNYCLYECELELVVYPLAFGVSPVNGSMTAVPLSNSNGTRVIEGIDVYSHDDTDTGHDNWVDILGTDVPGDAPAITKIQIDGVNLGGAPARIAMGLMKKRSITHILEDTSLTDRLIGTTGQSTGGSVVQTAGSGASGGTYKEFSVTSVDPKTRLGAWTLASPQSYGGQPYRAVAVSALGKPFDINMNYCLQINPVGSDEVFYQTDWISPLSAMSYLDLGVVVLPPFAPTLLNVADLHLSLFGYRKFAGTSTFSLDYIYLFPVKEGYRVLQNKLPAVSGSFGQTFVDDSWNNEIYAQGLQSGQLRNLGSMDGLFSPIRLLPGEDQRLYFLFDDLYSFQPSSFKYKVKVWVTPLYQTLA